LIASPLVSQDKVIGILRMDSPQEFAYTQDDLRLLTIISDLAAVAIQNAYLYSRTQELARRDDLTGLVVRRYFMERFREEIKRAAAKRQAFSLLILDIDHFKDYNDKYGHMAGDLVLKHMARILTSAVQEGDIVGRYGGEELIVLLVGRDKAEAIKEAQRLRNTIKERPFTLRRSQTKLTVSAGLSSYPKDAVTEEDLIRIADDRLYKAKTTGRDKVCSD
jgi:diguanylate cyclase (GGDEF)-like protein